LAISPNILGWRRFGVGNEAMRSIDPCSKCGGDETAQRAQPDWRFAEPELPKERRSANRLLNLQEKPDLKLFFLPQNIFLN